MHHTEQLREDRATADELYEAVLGHAWAIYPYMPHLVSVSRTGEYDGSWRLDHRHSRYARVQCDLPGERASREETAKLARLASAYAAHPDADPDLISRPSPENFPRCVDLYLG